MTISIDKEIHKNIKIYAARKGIKISVAIEKAITEFLKNEEIKAQKEML